MDENDRVAATGESMNGLDKLREVQGEITRLLRELEDETDLEVQQIIVERDEVSKMTRRGAVSKMVKKPGKQRIEGVIICVVIR